MSITVCLSANTLHAPGFGGHLWVYLNWALGLRSLGCNVIWLEFPRPNTPKKKTEKNSNALKSRLEHYDFADNLVIGTQTDNSITMSSIDTCHNLEAVYEADLLLNLAYDKIPVKVVERFKRSVLVDIDPGLTQIWISEGQMRVARHDLYFTIGETVGQNGALFPDCGLAWHYSPPPVFVTAWPTTRPGSLAALTTITSWWGEWVLFKRQSYSNSKREGFLPFLDLPQLTNQPLELAIPQKDEKDELEMLRKRGWRINDALEIASSPWRYQRYIQDSKGEFSCVKPSCVRLQNAWISDRTLCYMASGKPTVIQHTGSSRFLPDAAGMFRFKDLDEAVRYIEIVTSNYERECKNARALAEEYFDARKVVKRILEAAL